MLKCILVPIFFMYGTRKKLVKKFKKEIKRRNKVINENNKKIDNIFKKAQKMHEQRRKAIQKMISSKYNYKLK